MLPLSAELRLIAQECSWFMKSRLAFIPASCEQMHGCNSIKDLGGPAVALSLPMSFPLTPLIFIKDGLLTSSEGYSPFLMW